MPFEQPRLTHPQASIQHEYGSVSQRLRRNLQIGALLSMAQSERALALPRQEPDARHPVDHAPLLRQTKQPAQGCQLPVDRRGRHLLASALDEGLDQSFVNLVEPRLRQWLEFK